MRSTLSIILGLLLALMHAALAQAVTFTVPGSSATIQGAIDLATSGDTVLVSPGVYPETIDFLGKNITLQSTGGAAVTTIVAPATTPVVQITRGEGNGAVLDGFTLTGGRPAFVLPYMGNGGGIFVSNASPTITNNIITDNHPDNDGGGIYVSNAAPTITKNVIAGNVASSGGGICTNNASPTINDNVIADNQGMNGVGIYVALGAPAITNNSITGNIGGTGGGIFSHGASPLISQNKILGNQSNVAFIGGGGITLEGGGAAVVNDNVIADNSATDGSAIGLWTAGTPSIMNNTITGNTATQSNCSNGGGGTISLAGGSAADIIQNVIASNNANCHGGVSFLVPSGSRGPALINNTIVLNGGSASSGVYASGFYAATRLTNNIILAPPGIAAVYCDNYYGVSTPIMRNNVLFSDGAVAVAGSCSPQIGQNGNIAADPRLVAAAAGDFHLLADSPAIDAGYSMEPLIPGQDFEGAPRVQDGNGDCVAIVDMGAYEALATVPCLQSAVSRKVHGAAGTFDLPLSLADIRNPTTEPRTGPVHTLVFMFDKPVAAATAAVTEGIAIAATPTFSGNEAIVALSGVVDRQYVTVALTNVASADGGMGGSGAVRVGFLVGDVNQSRVVSVADLGLVNARLAQVATTGNFLNDVNASGAISIGDKGITNANLTKALPAP